MGLKAGCRTVGEEVGMRSVRALHPARGRVRVGVGYIARFDRLHFYQVVSAFGSRGTRRDDETRKE